MRLYCLTTRCSSSLDDISAAEPAILLAVAATIAAVCAAGTEFLRRPHLLLAPLVCITLALTRGLAARVAACDAAAKDEARSLGAGAIVLAGASILSLRDRRRSPWASRCLRLTALGALAAVLWRLALLSRGELHPASRRGDGRGLDCPHYCDPSEATIFSAMATLNVVAAALLPPPP